MLHGIRTAGTRVGMVAVVGLAVLGSLISVPVFAQGGVLEEVIVTARKRAEAIQDVPVSITAFTGNQLRDAGITNLKELGYQTPGLQIDQNSAAQEHMKDKR